ncbi:MAG TPA: RodZ domain-containing protein [Gammaproteobacteria bacterium]|nr:RodZ domain-containing protein [Gammaproteobacteria bacterium]
MADSDPPITTAAPPPPPPPQTLGEMLRGARLAHDLTVEQLSTELRIEARQLNALEENRFEQIGVPVFVKGYLKQYGQRLGLDVRELLALYYKQTTLADVQVQPSRTIKLHDDRQITTWVLAAVVLLLVAVGLAVWWWNGGSFSALPLTRSAPAPAVSATPSSAEAAAPQRRSVEQPAAPTPTSTPPPAAPTSTPPAAAAALAETPAPAADAAAASDVDSAAESEPAFVAPSDDGDEEPTADVDAIPLELTFDQESWAEVTDARGERLLYGLSAAGRRVAVGGVPPFAIVLGNASVVRLTVDGAPYPIPTTRREGDPSARFSVDVAAD